MKFLKESYGESEELNTFVYSLEKRYNPYYQVQLKLNDKISNNYFSFKEAAEEYYDKLVKEAKANKDYYDGADISLFKCMPKIEQDEISNEYIMLDEDSEDSFTLDDESK